MDDPPMWPVTSVEQARKVLNQCREQNATVTRLLAALDEPAGPSAMEEDTGAATEEERQLRQLEAQRVAYQCLLRAMPVPASTLAHAGCSTAPDPARSPATAVDGPSCSGSGAPPLSAEQFIALRRSRPQQRVQQRLQQLAKTPADLPPELQWQAVIEHKLMQTPMIELQRRVRQQVHLQARLVESTSERDLLDWSEHVRVKDQPKIQLTSFSQWQGHHLAWLFSSEAEVNAAVNAAAAVAAQPNAARAGWQFAQNQTDVNKLKRVERERNIAVIQARMAVLTARREFLQKLLFFRLDARDACKKARQARRARNDGVAKVHHTLNVKTQREERARIMALKNGDMEAYQELLGSAKNNRLKELLSKTDDLLEQLGQKVAEQRRRDGGDEEEEEVEAEQGRPGDKMMEGQARYNLSVHRLKTKITKQPACMTAGELRDYQVEGLQWMASLYNNHLNGILADEMGLGKTIQTIALFAYLMENKDVRGPHIVVAPKPVLSNWEKEFQKWLPTQMTVVLYDGKPEERKALREEYLTTGNFNVVLTHYDLILKDKAPLGKVNWKYIVVDEGHRLKNDKSKLAEVLRNSYKFKHRLLLTGTPINNNMQELWALLNFILPNIFNSGDNFDEWFSKPFKGLESGAEGEELLTEEESALVIHRLHNVLRPFLLRRKKSEVETGLPEKTDFVIFCDMSAWQRLYYQQVVAKKNIHSKSLQNMAMQLRKICNHPYLFVDEDAHEETAQERLRASGKYLMLSRILEKLHRTGHRVLLFSQMVRALEIVQDMLEDAGYKFLRLDGKTKPEERVGQVDAWNDDNSEYFIFILSTRAGGLGLNLQTADTVIILDSDWNPQQDLQAECRAHRIGQTKPVRVLTLASKGTIDEWILKRASEKKLIDNQVIQAGMFNTTSTAEDRQEALEDILKEGLNVATADDLPTEEAVNEMVARSDEEFLLFQEMDAAFHKRQATAQYSSELMTEEELPPWVVESIQQDDVDAAADVQAVHDLLAGNTNLGRGKRNRSNTSYREDLDESELAPRRTKTSTK